MLATAGEARDSSPDVILGTGASKDLDIKPSAAGSVHKKPGESVADSIAKELSYWEKVVFSFDMDRESGASSSGSGQRGSGQDNSRRQGRTGQAGSSSSSGNPASSSQTHAQANPNQPHNPQFSSHSPPLLSPMQLAQLGQMGALSLPGLDPYTVAQLTALSALVNQTTPPAPLPGTAQHNPSLNSPDAYAILRQMQGLLHPSSGPSNLPSSSQYPAYQSAFQQQPTATQSHVPSTATSSGHSAHHHPQHHPLAPNLPGLGWPLTQYPSIGQFPPHATSPHESSHQQPHGQGQTHSPPLIFPGLFPRQAQSPGAGPSTGGGSNESQSTVTGRTSTSPASPTTPMTPGPEMDETAMTEDKRRRNTAASGMGFLQAILYGKCCLYNDGMNSPISDKEET